MKNVKKLYLLLMALFLAMTANAAMYLHYDDGSDGWNNSIPQMNQSGNTYTYTLRTSGNVNFIISKSNSTDWDTFRGGNNFYYDGSADADYEVTSGNRFQVWEYGSGSKSMYIEHNYDVADITFKLETGSSNYMTVTVEEVRLDWDNVNPTANTMYLVGWNLGMNNQGHWTSTAKPFSWDSASSQYKCEFTTQGTEIYFKVKIGNYYYTNGESKTKSQSISNFTQNYSLDSPASGEGGMSFTGLSNNTDYVLTISSSGVITVQEKSTAPTNYTIQFDNTATQWGNVYVKVDDGSYAAMTPSGNIYSYTYSSTSAPTNVTFASTSGGADALPAKNYTEGTNITGGKKFTPVKSTVTFDNSASRWPNVQVKFDSGSYANMNEGSDNKWTASTIGWEAPSKMSFKYNDSFKAENITFASTYEGPKTWNLNGNTYPQKIVLYFNNNGKGEHEMTYTDADGGYWYCDFLSNNAWVNFTIRLYETTSSGYTEYYKNQGTTTKGEWVDVDLAQVSESYYFTTPSSSKVRIEIKNGSDLGKASIRFVDGPSDTYSITLNAANLGWTGNDVKAVIGETEYAMTKGSGNTYTYSLTTNTGAPSTIKFKNASEETPETTFVNAASNTYTPVKSTVNFDNSGSQWSSVKVKFDSGEYKNMTKGSGDTWSYSEIAWANPTKVSFSNASGAFTLADQTFTNNNTYVGVAVVTVTSVKIVKNGGTESGTFTKVNDTQWVCKRFKINGQNGDGNQYRVKVYYSDNSTAEFAPGASINNWGFGLDYTGHTLEAASGSNGWFLFKSPDYDSKDVTITVTVAEASHPNATNINIVEYSTPIEELVNMPLKPADFAGNKKHYFLVGSTQGAWRLQPEWEFTVSEDGTTATLPARLYYQGLFAIGVVDNFEDYAYHRYKLYTFNSDDQKKVKADVNSIQLGSTPRNAHGFIYTGDDSDNDFFGVDNCMLFTVDYTLTEDNLKSCKPKLALSTTLTLNGDGIPTNVAFDLSQKDNYADYMVFQLVGSDIKWDDMPAHAPMQHLDASSNMFYGTIGWEQAWIQYDEEGKPYIDANGDYMYQTVYKPEWFKKHPTLFWNKDVNTAEGGFFYDSSSITFINVDNEEFDKDDPYWSFYKHHANNVVDKFGGSVVVSSSDDASMFYKYTEKLITPELEGEGENAHVKYTYTTAGRSANWECYVAKDVWVQGEFKIWSGFGGNSVYYQPVGGMTDKGPQYYAMNGGHSLLREVAMVEGCDITTIDADEAVGYALNEDVYGANYSVGNTPKYFKRVVLWYDPVGGFNNSVVQFIVETYGPNITATRSALADGGFSANCSWNIPDADAESTDAIVTSYTINRYRVVDGEYVLDKEGVFTGTPNKTVATLGTVTNNGTAKLPSGRYVYEVVVNYQNALKASETYTKSAFSNVVTIYNATSPLTASANQVTQTVSGVKKYTFDLAVTLDLAEATKALVVPSEENEDELVPVSGFIDSYTIVPANATVKANLSKASNADDVTVTCNGVAVSNVTTNTETGAVTIPFQGASKSKVVVTYKDLPKGEYTFSANVTPKSGYAATNWATLNYQDTEVDGTIIVPDATVTISSFSLAKSTKVIPEGIQKEYLALNMLPKGAYKKSYDDGWDSLDEDEEPVLFNKCNEMNVTVKVDTKLTAETLGKWTADIPAQIVNAKAPNGVYTVVDATNSNLAAASEGGVYVHVVDGVLQDQNYSTVAGTALSYTRGDITNTGKTGASTKKTVLASDITLAAPTAAIKDVSNNSSKSNVVLFEHQHEYYEYEGAAPKYFYQIDAVVTYSYLLNSSTLNAYNGYEIDLQTRPNNADIPVDHLFSKKSAANGSIVHKGWTDVNNLDDYEVYDYADNYDDAKHNWSEMLSPKESDLTLHIAAVGTYNKSMIGSIATSGLGIVTVHPYAHYPIVYTYPTPVSDSSSSQSIRRRANSSDDNDTDDMTMGMTVVNQESENAPSHDLKNGVTTGIEDVATDSAKPVYYNIQGIRVEGENLRPGIYVEVRGNQARKIMVR